MNLPANLSRTDSAFSCGCRVSLLPVEIIGVMALGGRGTYLIRQLVERSDVEIAYICDADTRRYARAAEIIEEEHGYKPKFVQDFRKMLDQMANHAREVDAVH